MRSYCHRIAGIVLASFVAARPAGAQTPVYAQVNTPQPNNLSGVTDLVRRGDIAYAVGGFSSVHYKSTGVLSFDRTTALFDNTFRDLPVSRLLSPDGTGGVYLFGYGLGSAASRIFRLLPSGVLDSNFVPRLPTGALTSLTLCGGRLYAGGSFSQIDGQPAAGLASLDPATGAVLATNFGPLGGNISLSCSAGVLYISGGFSSVSGESRAGLAALDASTGNLLPWSPVVTPPGVTRAWATADQVYLTGTFTSVGGDPRSGIAGVDPVTAAVTPFSATIAGEFLSVRAIVRTATRLWIGGVFDTINGVPRRFLAGLDPVTGAVTAPDAGVAVGGFQPSAGVDSLWVDGGTIYLGGEFDHVGGLTRRRLAAVDENGSVTPWNPGFAENDPGFSASVVVSGTNVFFANGAVSSRVNETPRNAAFAFNVVTGEILPWDPHLKSPPSSLRGSAIVDDGLNLWIGGVFTAAGLPSRPKKNLVAVDATLGQPVFSFDEGAAVVGTDPVISLAVNIASSRIWGSTTSKLFGVVAVSGLPVPSGVPSFPSRFKEIIALDGQSMFAFGPLEKANLATGSVVPWPVGAVSYIRDIQVATDVYIAGEFTSAGGTPRDGLAALDSTTGALRPWAPALSRSILAPRVERLALDGERAIFCGEFDSVGGEFRSGVAAVHRSSGIRDPWYPVGLSYGCNAIHAANDRVVISGPLMQTTPANTYKGHYLAVVPSPRAIAGTTDMGIAISASPDPGTVTGSLTYTASISNAGPDESSQSTAAISFGSGVLIQSVSASQGACASSTGSVSCSLGALTAGGQATVTVVVRPLQAGSTSATATISALETDPVTSNNQSTITTTVTGTGIDSDISLSMTATSSPVILGNGVTYLLTVRNNGPSAATGVIVTDQYPSEVNLTSVTTPQGSCNGTSLITCTIPSLAANSQVVIQFDGTSTAAGTALNQANVYSNSSDPAPSNNAAFASTNVVLPGANLSVAMSATTPAVAQGQTITYTIEVFNAGPSVANNTVLTSAVPPGAMAISVTASVGSCSVGGTINCTLGALGSGSTAFVTIVLRADQQGTLTTTASVFSAANDPDPSDNLAGASVSVGPPGAALAELAISLTATPASSGTNLPITYTATATNAGPDAAVATSIVLTVPPAASVGSVTTTAGSCAGSNPITCTIPSFANGASATITVVLTVPDPGLATVTASISSAAGDLVPGNNTATASVTVVTGADLGLTVVDSADPVALGSTFSYTISVTNNGPLDATAVTVSDPLPVGTTFVSASTTVGSCSGTSMVVCSLGSLAKGAAGTVTITVTATGSGTITNTASVTGAEPDPVPSNDTASATTRVGSLPELRLTKSHTGNFTAGANGTFTLTLANQGTAANGFAGAPIQIASIANSRFGNDWTLDGLNMLKTRQKLLATSNFGVGGTVPRPVAISDVFAAKGSISKAALSGYDALFIGYFNDGSANTFTAAELLAMKEWVTDGGSILVSCDNFDHDNVCNAFGYPALATLDIANPMTPTALGTAHPAFSGPFGPVASFSGYQTIGFFYSSVGADVLARDPNGTPVVLEKAYGQGKVVFLSDVDFISTAATSGTGISSGNDRLLANLFAHAGRAGTIHVGDTLPAGLSFVSAAGTGWNCTGQGQTVGCNFTGALAPSASSSITVTTAVAPGATSSLTNRAVMSAYGDTDPTNNVAIDTVSLAGGAAVPSVNLVVPAKGPTAGGTAVTIYGSNFDAGATVRFAGNPATGVTVVNATTITATTPAGPQGPVDVSVTNPSTTSFSRPSAFLYEAPVVPTQLYTLVPCRLVDTRGAVGPYGGPALSANQTRTFALSGNCGIPADAVALSLNLTVLNATTGGEIVLAPAGISTPGTSASSFRAGSTRANNTLMPVNGQPLGSLSVTAKIPSGTVEVVIDVNGYFK
ncbi:MAG: DUF11 domain-containing protein [Acidobacteria bacterium]|nr:DUF11 domain-containing protein [Acidobacteriota bacterium]